MSEVNDNYYNRVTKHGAKLPPSEQVFLTWCRSHGHTPLRIGFDEQHDPIDTRVFNEVPEVLRKMPDYYVVSKDLQGTFVEVKGYNGRNSATDELKVKVSDIEQYQFWSVISPVWFFAYDNTNRVSFMIGPDALERMIDEAKDSIRTYRDNNQSYYPMRLPHESVQAGTTKVIYQ